MTNTVELEVAIKRAGLTKRAIAKKLGISEMGFYKKVNNITEFKASEIYKLTKILKLKDKDDIFFTQQVELNSTR